VGCRLSRVGSSRSQELALENPLPNLVTKIRPPVAGSGGWAQPEAIELSQLSVQVLEPRCLVAKRDARRHGLWNSKDSANSTALGSAQNSAKYRKTWMC
jgi:hypothetical protein